MPFGRRQTPGAQTARPSAAALPIAAEARASEAPAPKAPAATAAASRREASPAADLPGQRDDDDLRAWKAARRRGLALRLPWSSLYLMASLSFGIASCALPDSVNDAADWLLY